MHIMVRNALNTGAILLLILVFTTASSTIVVNPAVSSDETSASEEVIENTWAQKAQMPAPRSALGVAVVEGKIYAIGGKTRGLGGVALGTNEMYDPDTGTWTKKAAMPTPRASFAIAVCQKRIYCIGGFNCNSTEVYDPATDTWETKAQMPTSRWQLEANVANDKIYLMGGEPNQTLNEVYDPATNSWTTRASIPHIETGNYHQAGVYAASAVIDNKIYWIGVVGFFYSPLGFKLLNQMYSPENDSWSLREPPPAHITPEAAGVTTGVWAPKRIHVFGDDCYNVTYDPATDKWSYGKRISPTRADFGVAVVNDKIYVVGGGYFWSASDVNEQYTPFGYGTIPPVVLVLSPQNMTYAVNASLILALNRQVAWMGYSLDGQHNVTLTGNITLAGLTKGMHNVTVYARDTFGNIGASETIYFTIAEDPEPFLTVLVAVATVAVAVGVGFIIYFTKIKKKQRASATKGS